MPLDGDQLLYLVRFLAVKIENMVADYAVDPGVKW